MAIYFFQNLFNLGRKEPIGTRTSHKKIEHHSSNSIWALTGLVLVFCPNAPDFGLLCAHEHLDQKCSNFLCDVLLPIGISIPSLIEFWKLLFFDPHYCHAQNQNWLALKCAQSERSQIFCGTFGYQNTVVWACRRVSELFFGNFAPSKVHTYVNEI